MHLKSLSYMKLQKGETKELLGQKMILKFKFPKFQFLKFEIDSPNPSKIFRF